MASSNQQYHEGLMQQLTDMDEDEPGSPPPPYEQIAGRRAASTRQGLHAWGRDCLDGSCARRLTPPARVSEIDVSSDEGMDDYDAISSLEDGDDEAGTSDDGSEAESDLDEDAGVCQSMPATGVTGPNATKISSPNSLRSIREPMRQHVTITVIHDSTPYGLVFDRHATLLDLCFRISVVLAVPLRQQALRISTRPGLLKPPFPTDLPLTELAMRTVTLVTSMSAGKQSAGVNRSTSSSFQTAVHSQRSLTDDGSIMRPASDRPAPTRKKVSRRTSASTRHNKTLTATDNGIDVNLNIRIDGWHSCCCCSTRNMKRRHASWTSATPNDEEIEQPIPKRKAKRA